MIKVGPDSETVLEKCYMTLGDGTRVELLGVDIPRIEFEPHGEPETIARRSFSGTVTMQMPGKFKRFLKVYCENAILIHRLSHIGRKTKKKRTKKKLYGRICRAIYEQVKAGL